MEATFNHSIVDSTGSKGIYCIKPMGFIAAYTLYSYKSPASFSNAAIFKMTIEFFSFFIIFS